MISLFGILLENRVRVGDGILRMEECKQELNQGFDLVTAFMLDDRNPTEFIRKLAASGNLVLNDNGFLLVTSDGVTIRYVLEECQKSGVAHINIPGGSRHWFDILIPKAACVLFSHLGCE